MHLGNLALEKSKLITDITRAQNQVNSLKAQFANVLARAPPQGAAAGTLAQHDAEKDTVKDHITQGLTLQSGTVAGFAMREESIRTQLDQIIAPLQTLMTLLQTQRDALNQASQQMANPNLGSDDQIIPFLNGLEKELEKAAQVNRTIWTELNALK